MILLNEFSYKWKNIWINKDRNHNLNSEKIKLILFRRLLTKVNLLPFYPILGLFLTLYSVINKIFFQSLFTGLLGAPLIHLYPKIMEIKIYFKFLLDNSVYYIYKTHLKEIFKTNRYGYGISS